MNADVGVDPIDAMRLLENGNLDEVVNWSKFNFL